jgi:hypothetical protein
MSKTSGSVSAKLRCLASMVLFSFVAALAFSSGTGAFCATEDRSQVTHEEGSSCPDPGGGGDPCGPSCPCTCCPGHRPPVAFSGFESIVLIPPSADLIAASPTDLHPRDVDQSIFHPPRA